MGNSFDMTPPASVADLLSRMALACALGAVGVIGIVHSGGSFLLALLASASVVAILRLVLFETRFVSRKDAARRYGARASRSRSPQ